MNEAARVLESIRRTELEAAQRVEQAKSQADEIVAEAKARAQKTVEEGRRRGTEAAQARYAEAMTEIEDEAVRIRQEGIAEANRLKSAVSVRIDELVDEMIEVVLAPPQEKGA